MLTIVSATAHDESSFRDNTFLSRSLNRLQKVGVDFDLRVVFRNPPSVGLSQVYNRVIYDDATEQILVLVHDDVSIEDMLLDQKLSAALAEFDLVGTAGGDPPIQAPGWCNPNWPVFGCVAHADREQPESIVRPAMTYYGPSPHACRVIDGHFMALIPAKIVQA